MIANKIIFKNQTDDIMSFEEIYNYIIQCDNCIINIGDVFIESIYIDSISVKLE